VFNPKPQPGDTIIPRNYGRGPGQFTVNMRLSRTFGFGSRKEESSGDWRPLMGGGGRGGGPPMGMAGGHGRGMGGIFGDTATGKRFNVTLGITAHNLLNFVNLSPPVGNLSSPLFGQSLSLGGGFGPMGASAAANRRIDMQLRFTF
jgi:hypothetical protein